MRWHTEPRISRAAPLQIPLLPGREHYRLHSDCPPPFSRFPSGPVQQQAQVYTYPKKPVHCPCFGSCLIKPSVSTSVLTVCMLPLERGGAGSVSSPIVTSVRLRAITWKTAEFVGALQNGGIACKAAPTPRSECGATTYPQDVFRFDRLLLCGGKKKGKKKDKAVSKNTY